MFPPPEGEVTKTRFILQFIQINIIEGSMTGLSRGVQILMNGLLDLLVQNPDE